MYVDKPSGERGSWHVYVATLVACAVFLGLAGLAFQISTDVVGPATEESEPQGSRLLRPWRLAARPVEPRAPVGAHKPATRPQYLAPVLISRAPDDGNTGVAVSEEMASPDVDEWTSTEQWSPDRTDTFRTVCVRLCDGASFPISFATTRDRFKADAARCKSGCGSPARLFVGPPDGEMQDLADVKGHAYSELANAFKFRTGYDAACTCKGQPWETAELERHKALAEAAKAAALTAVDPAVVAASQAVPRMLSNMEIAALHPAQSLRTVAPAEPVRLLAARPESVAVAGSVAAAIAVVDGGERKKAGSRKVTRVLANKAAKAQTVAAAGPIANPFQVAFGTPPKAGKAKPQGVDTSMQRPFKPKEYWRLSYWEVAN